MNGLNTAKRESGRAIATSLRTILAVVAIALTTVEAEETKTADTRDERYVIPRSQWATIRCGPSEAADISTDCASGCALRVSEVRGFWLHVGYGWILESDVIGLTHAKNYFSNIIRHAPSAFGFTGRACALLDEGDSEGAIQDSTHAIQLDRQFAPAYCCRATALIAVHRYADAVHDFTDAIRIHAGYLQAYRGRAEACIKSSDHRRAADDLSVLCASPARDAKLLAMLGVNQYLIGDDDNAIIALSEASRCGISSVNKTYAKALLRRGEMLRDHGRNDQAIVDFNQAIRVAPDFWPAYFQRASLHNAAKRYDLAALDFERVTDLDPTNYLAHAALGSALTRLGQPAKGVRHLTKSIELGFNGAAPYFFRAEARYLLGQYDDAVADFTSAINVGAKLSGVFAARGEAYAAAGRFAEALRDFDESIRRSPDDPGLYRARSALLSHLGRNSDAERDATTAADLEHTAGKETPGGE
jgi:tetratricopeptide (TPR) repeat protein